MEKETKQKHNSIKQNHIIKKISGNEVKQNNNYHKIEKETNNLS